jgi:hypothetical protein
VTRCAFRRWWLFEAQPSDGGTLNGLVDNFEVWDEAPAASQAAPLYSQNCGRAGTEHNAAPGRSGGNRRLAAPH